MHFGIVTPPVSGHIHPFSALGRTLIERGHRVTVFHMPDLAEKIRGEGLEFAPVGESDHPLGSLPKSLAELATRGGLSALRFTIGQVRKTSEMICRDAPQQIRARGVDALLVDQMEPAGGAIADHLKIPFITVCNALLLNEDVDVPPPFTPWRYRSGTLYRLRNRLGYAISRRATRPVTRVVNRYRRTWGLRPYRKSAESFSRLAQISQMPAALDFPRSDRPVSLHSVGPLRRAPLEPIPFPWERLNGKPIVYASLGTLQNRRVSLFRVFAEACADLPVQLVLTHGRGLDESTVKSFPGTALVVNYAPQDQVLLNAKLTITHAGLNTVLDSLAAGVPIITIPITYEQPAIAQRVVRSGAGVTLTPARVDVEVLRGAITQVIENRKFYEHAQRLQREIQAAGGCTRAAEIIETALR